jgi:hypothetical protein
MLMRVVLRKITWQYFQPSKIFYFNTCFAKLHPRSNVSTNLYGKANPPLGCIIWQA